MHDTTNMVQPTNTNLFPRSEVVRTFPKEKVEKLLEDSEDTSGRLKIAVEAQAGLLYDNVCYSVQSYIIPVLHIRAQPLEFVTSDLLGLANDLNASQPHLVIIDNLIGSGNEKISTNVSHHAISSHSADFIQSSERPQNGQYDL